MRFAKDVFAHVGINMTQYASSSNKKIVDLSRDTVDAHTNEPQTTDHGVRINNTDNWLKVGNERHTGPSLLEDQIAREKVTGLTGHPGLSHEQRSLTTIFHS